MDINTCLETTGQYHTIAYYSHLVPTFLALFLGFYSLIKTKYSKLSIAFLVFVGSFSLWLLNDLILWTSQNYNLIYFFWSWIDYIDVLFFVCGAFFFILLTKGSVKKVELTILITITIPAFIFAFSGNNLINFDQTVCEAINNNKEVYYKTFVEMVSVITMIYALISSLKNKDKTRIKLSTTVFIAMLFFFATFSSTDFISAATGIYEINLYGLFVLPVFLIVMVFAITNLGLFQFRLLGTQILAYILIIMVGSQFLYLQDSSDRNLSVITFAIALFLAYLLLQNAKKEAEARLEIERLAGNLQVANEGQANLIHIINHQIKGYLAKSRNIFSELSSNSVYGPIPEKAKPMIDEGFNSLTEGVDYVQRILISSNADRGTLEYKMAELDFKKLVAEAIEKQEEIAKKKNLKLEQELAEEDFKINGDEAQLKEAVRNLIDNSIIYTKEGSVKVILEKRAGKILLEVKDTGIGLTDDDKRKLFTKGGKGKDSMKINVNSSGFGLAFVKGVVEAHKGRVWAESEGPAKGSVFTIELPV